MVLTHRQGGQGLVVGAFRRSGSNSLVEFKGAVPVDIGEQMVPLDDREHRMGIEHLCSSSRTTCQLIGCRKGPLPLLREQLQQRIHFTRCKGKLRQVARYDDVTGENLGPMVWFYTGEPG